MATKRPIQSTSLFQKGRRRRITLDLKFDIVKLKERGETTPVISRFYGVSERNVNEIWKNREKIKKMVQTVGACHTITRVRSYLMEEMERILNIWIEDQRARHTYLSQYTIQRKAREIWNILKEQRVENTNEDRNQKEPEPFNASETWFGHFRRRYNLPPTNMPEEGLSTNQTVVHEFKNQLMEIIQKEGYSADQLFNFDETILYWKKLPGHAFVFKVIQDSMTLVLGGNATGDFKLKPCMIYPTKKSFKKIDFPVYYKTNRKSWMTGSICIDYMQDYVGPAIEEYLKKKNKPNKALLIVDSVPGHPKLMEDICPNIKVIFLPLYTSNALQPIEQNVNLTFRALYLRQAMQFILNGIEKEKSHTWFNIWKKYQMNDAIENLASAWEAVSQATINNAWQKLCPEVVDDSKTFTDVLEIKKDIVRMAKEAGIDGIGEDRVEEYLTMRGEELSIDDIQKLIREQPSPLPDDSKREPGKVLNLKVYNAFFSQIRSAIALCKDHDPIMERSVQVTEGIEEAIRCYETMYEEEIKKSKSQDVVIVPGSSGKCKLDRPSSSNLASFENVDSPENNPSPFSSYSDDSSD